MEKILRFNNQGFHIGVDETEALAIRAQIDQLFPPKIGPWTVRKARGGAICVSRDIPGKAPECAASHCDAKLAQRIADLLNGADL